MTFRVSERFVQAVLMWRSMERFKHEIVVPNVAWFYTWEADLLAVTKAGLIHEFEVKISPSDYKADAKKDKHRLLKIGHGPSYFWYATTFEIDEDTLPEYAGWIYVDPETGQYTDKVPAPRINRLKLNDWKWRSMARLLAFKLKNAYQDSYMLHIHRDGRNEL